MPADAEQLLIDEFDQRIKELEETTGTCNGHGAIARGLGLLLRTQRSQLLWQRESGRQALRISLGAGGGIAILVTGLLELAQQWLKG